MSVVEPKPEPLARRPSALDWVRSAFAWVYIALDTAAFAVATVLVSFTGGDRWFSVVGPWARSVVPAMGGRPVRVVNRERLGQAGVLIMANHQSHLDPPLLLSISPIPLRFLAKKSLFRIPFFGQALWATGQIPIDRSRRTSAFASVDRVADEISRGKSVIIFPEGTRACDGQMGPFKRGGFLIASRGSLPILPLGIAGTRQAWAPGSGLLMHEPIVVVVGEPIDTSMHTPETKEALMVEVREAIDALRSEAWRLWEQDRAAD